MIRELFRAYAHTPLSVAIQQSSWAFATIEVFHLIALAALGGAVLVGTLRQIAPVFRFAEPARVWAGVRPVIVGSVIAIVVSGVLLVGVNPLKYYFDDVFRVKIAFLALALIATAYVDRRARIALSGGAQPSRIAAAVAATLWLGVGLAGRWIGLL